MGSPLYVLPRKRKRCEKFAPRLPEGSPEDHSMSGAESYNRQLMNYTRKHTSRGVEFAEIKRY